MFGFIKHLFIPHAGNNHRAKILHNSSILFLILGLFTLSFVFRSINASHPDVLGVSYSISENDLIALVNAQRQQNNLSPLQENSALDDAARRKAADMFAKNYWAHFAPDGSTSPWGFIKAAGYSYQFAGENLAKGFTDSGSVVSAWMNSPSHRDNILSSHFKDVGFAIVPGTLQGEDTVLVVEMFGATSAPVITDTAPQTVVKAAESNNPAPTVAPTGVILPTVAPKLQVTPAPVAQANSGLGFVQQPKIDAAITSKAASTVGLSLLAVGFLMDTLIVERKKIPRVVGHNLDHIILIIMFILFIVLAKGGVII